MKKILVIYTSIGAGHKAVGQSIAQALRKRAVAHVRELDLFKQNESAFTRAFERVYIRVVTDARWIWAMIYKSSLFNRLTLPLRVPIAGMKSGKFAKYLKSEKFDLIVTTHTAASAMVSAMKRAGKFTGKFVISFSDWHFHPYWFYEEADKVLAQTKEQVTELLRRGYAREKIVKCGLAVNEAFGARYEEGGIYQKFNLSRVKPLILLIGGSRGWGIRIDDIKELLETKYDVQLAVVCGTDTKLRQEIVKLVDRHPIPARVYGFLPSEDLAQLFYIAKIIVTKPGGSTIGEALASSTPMILVNPLPAMEELNQSFLVNRQAAVSAKSPLEVRRWVERLLQDRELYRDLKAKMAKIGSKVSADLAAKEIIDIL